MKAWMSSNFGQIGRPLTMKLAAIERPIDSKWENGVSLLVCLFLIVIIKVAGFKQTQTNFGHKQIDEIVSHMALKCSYMKIVQNILMTILVGSRVSDRCPLGYLSAFPVPIVQTNPLFRYINFNLFRFNH